MVTIIEENGNKEHLSDSYKKSYEAKRKQLCEKAEEEVRLMRKVYDSSNVVKYFEYKFYDWKEKNRFGCDLLIHMELLENLRDLMKQGSGYTEKEIIQIGKDICKALVVCHEESIIHRDIKPENIFRTRYGEYKLGDFGIARMVGRSNTACTMIGTPAYAAPE